MQDLQARVDSTQRTLVQLAGTLPDGGVKVCYEGLQGAVAVMLDLVSL